MSIEKVLEQHTEQDAENFQRMEERLDRIEVKLTNLTELVTRYRGFLGGILFVLSALGAILSFFGSKLGAWFHG